MRLTADFHTHTLYSHGSGSVDDNVQAAIRQGLQAVGIADHSVDHALYGIKRRSLSDYLSHIADAKKKYEDRIDVRAGIELDLTGLDGSVDMPNGKFDTVILGYHKAAVCRDIRTVWTFATGRYRGHAAGITQGYIRAIQRRHIDIIAHPGYGVPVDYKLLGQACADYGTLFEINNKHGELTPEDIWMAASSGARFVISSDAHTPADVGQAPHALELVKRTGLLLSQMANVTED